jgi:oligopeptidase B
MTRSPRLLTLLALLLAVALLPMAACSGTAGAPDPAPELSAEAPPVVAETAADAADAADRGELPAPPVARREPHELETHGHVRVDDYYWLRDRESPGVIGYLEAENAYTDAALAHTEALQEELYEEIVARIPQKDESAPVFDSGYWYFSRYEEGEDYPVYLRRPGTPDGPSGPEEVMLDGPEMAEGHEFFSVAGLSVSPDNRVLAYGLDTVGRRKYTVRFKDLSTGETLPDELVDRQPGVAWAADSKTLFYTGKDPQTLRADSIHRHVLGTDPAGDVEVYREDDEEYNTFVFESRSGEYLMIGSFQTETSEYRYLPSDDPTGDFRVFAPREEGHSYQVDHAGDSFYLLTNDTGKNFRVASTPEGATGREHWTEVVAHRDDVYLSNVTAFAGHLVLSEREGGLTRIRVLPRPAAESVFVLPLRSDWARESGVYPSSVIASKTRCRVSDEIGICLSTRLFITYETVARETPARRATSA